MRYISRRVPSPSSPPGPRPARLLRAGGLGLWLLTVGCSFSRAPGRPVEVEQRPALPQEADASPRVGAWQVYTTAHGLAGNQVFAIAPDEEGQVWFGTDHGVSRFNGAAWKPFRQGLPTGPVSEVLVDSQRQVWAGTEKGLFCLSGDRWQRIASVRGTVRSLWEDRRGHLWVATERGVWQKQGPAWRRTTTREGLPAEEVTALAVGSEGNLWAATERGLATFRDGRWQAHPGNVRWPGGKPSALSFDVRGRPWCGTTEGAAFFDGSRWQQHVNWDHDGNGVWDGHLTPVAALDVDGDSALEVVATMDADYDLQPRGLLIFDAASGREEWHYYVGPRITPNYTALADMDGDGLCEIFCGSSAPCNGSQANGTDDGHGYVFAWRGDGILWWRRDLPGTLDRIPQPIQVSLVEGGGEAAWDLLVFIQGKTDPQSLGWGALYRLDPATGRIVQQCSVDSPLEAAALANLDGQPGREIVALHGPAREGEAWTLRTYDPAFRPLSRQPLPQAANFAGAGDLDGDGAAEVACTVATTPPRLCLFNGSLQEVWSTSLDGPAHAIPSYLTPHTPPGLLVASERSTRFLGIRRASATANRPGSLEVWPFPGRTLARTGDLPGTWSRGRPDAGWSVLWQRENPYEAQPAQAYTADLNGDGNAEGVLVQFDTVRAFNHRGDVLWQRQIEPQRRLDRTLALADATGDGQPDVLVAFQETPPGAAPELVCLEGRQGAVWQMFRAAALETRQLPDNRIHDLLEAEDGSLWFATERGVSRFNTEGWLRMRPADSGLPSGTVYALAQDRSRNLWFGTDAGVARYDQSWETFPDRHGLLAPDGQGGLWVGPTGGEDLVHYTPVRRGSPDPAGANSVRRGSPDPAGAADREVSPGEGSVRRPSLNQFPGFLISPSPGWQTFPRYHGYWWASNWMKALATGPGGTFLFGAWTSGRWSGLTVVRPNGRVDRFSRLEREGWVHLWSEGAGLHREALSGTRPSSDEIRAISVDAQGEVWCATPQGLNRFDGQKWQIFMAPGGLAENDLTSVAVAPDGAVWCGTRERGLRCYRAGRWQTFTPSEGLADLRVQVLAAAPSGRIYAGTARGLSLYEPTRAAWQTVTDPAGPGEASITSLALDGETLWVGTPEGLWCFQGVIHALRRTTKPEHVGQSVRLPSPAEQTNSLRYMDRGGAWLHYSLLDGLPTNHVASLAVPRPGELYLWTKAGGLLRHVRETVPPQVWFPPKTPKVVRTSQALTFPVHGADLGCAPEELQYSWRLVPGEEAWSPFQARSVLDVGSRPNGSYRLEVRARDRDGNVSHSAVHRFTVDADPVKIVSLYLGDAPHINALFPALHTRYAQLGGVHLVLRNQRPTAVEATCTVQLEGWMDRPLSETHVLEAEETQVLPLPLPLSAAVLKLSEERTVTAEVTVQVPSQDSAPPPLVRQHVPVRIYHPKRIYWGWPEMAAAFITPEDPRIQDALRSKWRIDPQAPRIRRVEARYETVQRWGVSYACDPNNPFSVVHSRKQLDSLQFPRQLLTRRAGDCDDLAVFFATLLEASGIPTALVHTDEHVLVAFQDDNGPLSRQFARYRLPGTPWIPVETTLLDAQGKDQTSFLSALLQAQAICQQSVRKPALYETARAWEEYPAATWPAEESGGR